MLKQAQHDMKNTLSAPSASEALLHTHPSNASWLRISGGFCTEEMLKQV